MPSSSTERALLAALVALLALAAPARGQARLDEEARAHRDAGARLYASGAYAESIEEFKKAYAIQPEPDFLYNIGQAERMRGNCPEALRAYREYLATDPPPTRRENTILNIGKCEGRVAAASEEKPEPPEPTGSPPATRIGPIDRPDHGEPPPVEPWYRDKLGGVLAGSGLVCLVGSGALFLSAELKLRRASDSASLDDLREAGQQAHNYRVAGGIVGGVGAALVIGGVVRYATRSPASSSDVQVGAAPLDGGLFVSITFLR